MESRTNDRSVMDRVYSLFKKSDSHSYDALQSQDLGPDQNTYIPPTAMSLEDPLRDEEDAKNEGEPFSWFEYFIFFLLGVAMLWAW
jgi:equilibrative nucleoside transporter 1/2/3